MKAEEKERVQRCTKSGRERIAFDYPFRWKKQNVIANSTWRFLDTSHLLNFSPRPDKTVCHLWGPKAHRAVRDGVRVARVREGVGLAEEVRAAAQQQYLEVSGPAGCKNEKSS